MSIKPKLPDALIDKQGRLKLFRRPIIMNESTHEPD